MLKKLKEPCPISQWTTLGKFWSVYYLYNPINFTLNVLYEPVLYLGEGQPRDPSSHPFWNCHKCWYSTVILLHVWTPERNESSHSSITIEQVGRRLQIRNIDLRTPISVRDMKFSFSSPAPMSSYILNYFHFFDYLPCTWPTCPDVILCSNVA